MCDTGTNLSLRYMIRRKFLLRRNINTIRDPLVKIAEGDTMEGPYFITNESTHRINPTGSMWKEVDIYKENKSFFFDRGTNLHSRYITKKFFTRRPIESNQQVSCENMSPED